MEVNRNNLECSTVLTDAITLGIQSMRPTEETAQFLTSGRQGNVNLLT